jgi:choline-sulfatase
VSLVDAFPTIVECVGAPVHPDDRDLPGASLFEVAHGTISSGGPSRTILSEYHAAGAATGAFMIRKGRFKYVYYAGMPPQLFDLDADPQEARDLGTAPGYQGLIAQCERELRAVVDPDAADALAKADQRARIAAFGGREAIIARGSFGYSPAPGSKPVYN